ncbi:hypothetical protein [Streptomyces spectabilis]|uniref:Uncharacterized protein n=2 Tax=Streptomyces spectabilis TaxID=68270 RepID=A0A5P2X7F3_STRST|nr:hypothetical protein [Streptomyces spectabilis]MBB5108221.1 hypothetical protein [Streptomyces spectabilis]MCI3900983.1 hypothetical protein [Streptomyces spectabilis]QEV58486.1 hypothetical protein CP982_07010 [Streptomyces spectabilis]GGV45292.1 hypothetical protein GCM10010245_70820 [Streptomyces spectabilis]
MDAITPAEGTFAEALAARPQSALMTGQFRIKLFYPSGTFKGYLNRNGDNWAIISQDPLTLEFYEWNGVTYYKIPGESRYLSVSNSAYGGFYGWSGATSFRLNDDKELVSNYNEKLASFRNGEPWLFFWDEYNIFKVEFEKV